MKNALFGYFYGLIFALKFVKKLLSYLGSAFSTFAELQNIMKKE